MHCKLPCVPKTNLPNYLSRVTVTIQCLCNIILHHQLYVHPPPTYQGLAALIGLNLLEQAFPDGLPRDWHDPAKLHAQLEAMRLAFADAFAFNSDPEHMEVPLDVLLSKEYAARQWRAYFEEGKVGHALVQCSVCE